jgi:hypothetical protein
MTALLTKNEVGHVVLYAPEVGQPSWAWCACGWTSGLCWRPDAGVLHERHLREVDHGR